jgi:DNA (cytosine-5)-methyltransferase 1
MPRLPSSISCRVEPTPANGHELVEVCGISLFSGVGGLDLGLEQAGIRIGAWVEWNHWARETLRRNFPVASRALLRDVTTISPEEVRWTAGLNVGDTFALAGAPPCQPWSTVGRRGQLADRRGRLAMTYSRYLRALRPRFFIFENVPGLASALVVGPMQQTSRSTVLDGILIEPARRLGYEVVVGVVDAADYGVPQRRLRLIVLGSRDHEFQSGLFAHETGRQLTLYDLLPPTHAATHTQPHQLKGWKRRFGWCSAHDRLYAALPAWRTLAHALADLPTEPVEVIDYSEAQREVFKLLPPGANWRYLRDNADRLPPDILRKAMGGALAQDSWGGRTSFWRRLAWEEPCSTLVTRPNLRATGLCHPTDLRPLSFREYCRVQSFPDSFEVLGPLYARYRFIGNAVPVGLARAVGTTIVRAAQHTPWPEEVVA